jgi:hypothetical protein
MTIPNLRNILAESYLDYVNDFISVARFAEYYNLTESEARLIVEAGKLCHETRLAR